MMCATRRTSKGPRFRVILVDEKGATLKVHVWRASQATRTPLQVGNVVSIVAPTQCRAAARPHLGAEPVDYWLSTEDSKMQSMFRIQCSTTLLQDACSSDTSPGCDCGRPTTKKQLGFVGVRRYVGVGALNRKFTHETLVS